MTDKVKIPPKMEIFCQEYILDLNTRYAAERCGIEMKQAARWLRKADVIARVNELKKDRLQRIGITADYVLQKLVDIDRMDVADILFDDFSVKPLCEWPEPWRCYIGGIDIAEIMDGAALLKKMKWPDKVKNLELLGKHVSVNAFKESLDLSGHVEGGAPTVIQLVPVSPDDKEDADE